VDQHFLKRQRFNRLLSAVLAHPEKIGVGIDEGTAVVVTAKGWRVIGASQVLLIQAQDKEKCRHQIHLLQPGDTWPLTP
jgi:cyanophycinase